MALLNNSIKAVSSYSNGMNVEMLVQIQCWILANYVLQMEAAALVIHTKAAFYLPFWSECPFPSLDLY